MLLSPPLPVQRDNPFTTHVVDVKNPTLFLKPKPINLIRKKKKKFQPVALVMPNIRFKHIPYPSLDRHIKSNNKIRTALKLKTLIISRPQHTVPLNFLEKYRNYLCFPEPISVYEKISTYPTIFEFFRMPELPGLFVRLTKEAAALADEEMKFKSSIESILATRVQKFLMLAANKRILLRKIAYIHDDLGLPPNFRHRFCNDHPDKFKIVDTPRGPFLELVKWDPSLAESLPQPSLDLIVDRPLKFRTLGLRRRFGLGKRWYDFLLDFRELPDICPYTTLPMSGDKFSIEFEKRGCAAVREVLALTIERWTLIDHLMLFRSNFGLLTNLRGMLLRHPDFFHVSRWGQRDSVMLVEGFGDEGELKEKDGCLLFRERLLQMVLEGNRMWRNGEKVAVRETYVDGGKTFYGKSEYVHGFEDLFRVEHVSHVNDYTDAESFIRGWESWFVNPPSVSSAEVGA